MATLPNESDLMIERQMTEEEFEALREIFSSFPMKRGIDECTKILDKFIERNSSTIEEGEETK